MSKGKEPPVYIWFYMFVSYVSSIEEETVLGRKKKKKQNKTNDFNTIFSFNLVNTQKFILNQLSEPTEPVRSDTSSKSCFTF